MPGKALIDHGRLLDVLHWEVELIVDAAEGARHDARVPSCPGLTIGETVRHLGSVYRMVVAWLREGKRPGQWQRDPSPGESAGDYMRAGFAELADELASRDPGTPAGTWWPADQTAGFWRRRMAHETTIHRTDVQSAAGLALDDIADEVALDGIDEALLLWFGHRLDVLGVSGTRNGSVGVLAADRYWVAKAGPSVTDAERTERSAALAADAVVSGAPMRVYLWLWGRLATAAVDTDGDEDAVAQLWALLRLATR